MSYNIHHTFIPKDRQMIAYAKCLYQSYDYKNRQIYHRKDETTSLSDLYLTLNPNLWKFWQNAITYNRKVKEVIPYKTFPLGFSVWQGSNQGPPEF